MSTAPSRVPQQERSRATQARLLEATVDCLVEHGWSGTTTTVVAARAGVSRGAQLHHYPTKAALVTAAVTHLTERRAAELRAEAAALPSGPQRLDGVVDLLAASFTGPLFAAALELWVAARTDAELRAALVPLEARIGREMYRLTVELLGVDERKPGVRESVQATLDLLRGLGVANLLSDDSPRRAALLQTWKRQLAALLTPESERH
ncbi:TetR/AcrR family transcriptional regulator [Micromonospora chalcea]|uniref:TetR/AcrR family transcriptional regulator n=1 Tax=Micromonospora TaxID=1873 RepID=UPI000939CF40|nr:MULTISPECIES: TetR/AcrR family transcriptional regulator [unclassified Micromonospora]AXO34241.1 transcriptional regulator TetR family [Micromonospora sp. B006]OKJ44638.1 TetR family transcriptional regulator [Micromonospora sp. TSRI0369]